MDSVLFQDVRVFDGERVRQRTSVLIRQGMIIDVGDQLGAPRGTQRIDGTGRTVLPGLIDAHTHVCPGALEQALVFGVTTELDMFADPLIVTDLKRQAEQRSDLADLRSAGTGATAPGGHPTQLAKLGAFRPFPTLSRPSEADEFVAARQAEGSDYLKIIIEPGRSFGFTTATLTPDTVRALVVAAHRHKLRAVAHATDYTSAQLAVRAGVDGLAHLFVDTEPENKFAERLAEYGTFVIPTLVLLETFCGQGAGEGLIRDDRVGPYLQPFSRAMLVMGSIPANATARRNFGVAVATLTQLHEAGVSILAGTDASNPGTAHGASMHRELQLLVQAGLSPAEALTAATATPAACFGLTDRGRIASGLIADLLLVQGDPSTDITDTTNIVGVWRRGVRVDRDAYRERIASVVATAHASIGSGADAVANTARWMAAERARESTRSDRLFTDPLAATLAGQPGRALAEQFGGGQWDDPSIAVRTRFFDDVLTSALSGTGIRQVVLLAAGMDTRAYRLPVPPDTTWFELDQPHLLALKETLLHDAGTTMPRCARRPVGVDFTADWPRALSAAGFQPDRAVIWLIEGLFVYRDAAAVDELLNQLTAVSVAGSQLFADIIGQSFLDSAWTRPWLDQLATAGMAWRFGTDRPEDLFTAHGWRATVTRLSTVGTQLGRWPLPDFPRNTPNVPQSYLIHATR